MMVVTILAILGAVGNVVLGAVLCIVVYRRRMNEAVFERRESVSSGDVRIISPYKTKEKRGDGR